MELSGDIHIAVKFVEECGLNPVRVMSTSGLKSPTGTKAEEIVGYSSWTNLMLKDKHYKVWTANCQDYIWLPLAFSNHQKLGTD